MKIQLKLKVGSISVEVPEDFMQYATPCKGCGKRIYWAKTENGKSMPVSQLANGDYVSHFFDCPDAKKFKK